MRDLGMFLLAAGLGLLAPTPFSLATLYGRRMWSDWHVLVAQSLIGLGLLVAITGFVLVVLADRSPA